METRILPVKTPRYRRSALALQAQQAREQKHSLAVDPLMTLAEAVPLLGSPSYNLLRKWIADGKLRTWRIGNGHIKIRLSAVKEFVEQNEVHRAG